MVAQAEITERGPLPFGGYDLDGDRYVTQMEYTEMRNKRIENKARQGYPLRGRHFDAGRPRAQLNIEDLFALEEFYIASAHRHDQAT